MAMKILFCVFIFALALILLPLALYLLIWIFLSGVSLFYNPKKKYKKPSAFSYGLLNFGYRIICSMARVKIHFKGKELLPQNEKFAFVSNHRSKFDNMVQAISLKKEKIVFVSKIQNFKIPIARRYIARNCYFPLERGNHRSAIEMIIASVRLIKENIASVGIYPEGTRSRDGQLLPFHPGCFKIAQKAKCPLVLGVIQGTEKIHKNFPWKKTHVYFEIIKVYKDEEIENKSTIDLAKEAESLIKEKISLVKDF